MQDVATGENSVTGLRNFNIFFFSLHLNLQLSETKTFNLKSQYNEIER